MKIKPFLLFTIFFYSLNSSATTIQPFENLGEMTLNTQTVVKATVIKNYITTTSNTTHHRFDLKVDQVVKGALEFGEIFTMQNYHNIIGDVERTIWGDINLEEGKTYLLFLDQHPDGYWRTVMLSYATFEEYEVNDEKVMVPFGMGTEVHVLKTSKNKNVEPLEVYKSDYLLRTLRNINQGMATWDKVKVIAAGLKTKDFNSERDLPAYCTTLSGGVLARWRDIEESPLPVYYHEDLDSGCGNTATQVENAINDINTNYSGLTLENSGTHDFVPSCVGGGATDSEFTNYITSTYFDARRNLIQFDDPCNEIADLSGCSGTLAVGGLYWSSNTYVYLGETYRTALFGYVVINNGTGACQCGSSEYAIMMAHELTHTLNLGHISPAEGDANMNPSCCIEINALDQGCANGLYPLAALPVELADFNATLYKEAVKLSWSTSSEINSNYFTLERMNLIGEFEEIAEIQSSSKLTGSSYEYLDQNPQYGKNIYRLTQTDKDGHFQILKATTINVTGKEQINIYPNPLTTNTLNIETKGIDNSMAQVTIYDLHGKKVYDKKQHIQNYNSSLVVDMTNQPSGIYMVRVVSQGQTLEKKIVK